MRIRYDDVCITQLNATATSAALREEVLASAGGEGLDCQLSALVPKKMKQPVFVYYELTNFYQVRKGD
jgi:hypothetical protein